MIAIFRRVCLTAITLMLLLSSRGFALSLPVRTFEEGEIPKVGSVFGMLQDHQGVIWIWGSRGITTYDGNSFRHLGVEEGLPSNYVYTLHVDEDGSILISSYGGLSRYHPDSRSVEPIFALRTESPVRDAAVHPRGYLLASDGGAMFVCDGSLYLLPTMSEFRHGNANCMVNHVAYDSSRDVLWAATDRFGVLKVDLKQAYPLLEMKQDTIPFPTTIIDKSVIPRSPEKIQPASIFKIDDPDERYRRWLAACKLLVPEEKQREDDIGVWTTDGLLYDKARDCVIVWDNRNVYRIDDDKLTPMLQEMPTGTVHSVQLQWDGSLSICRSDGLYRVTDDGIIHIGGENGLLSSNLTSHLHGRQGHDWVIDHHGDLHRLLNSGIDVFSGVNINGLRDVRRVVAEGDGFLIASAHSLFRLRNGKLNEIPIPGKLGGEIIDAGIGPRGEIFLTTANRMFQLDEKRGLLRDLLGDGPNHVGRMVFGSSGEDLWALFHNRLFHWDGQRMRQHSPFVYINPLFIDVLPEGIVHLGHWASLTTITPTNTRIYLNEILFENPVGDAMSRRLSADREVPYPKGKMLDEMAAITGATGPDGAYYVGTFNAGIVRLIERSDPVETVDRMRVEDTRTGLPSNMINSMSVGPDGTLYFILGRGAVAITSEGMQTLHLPLPDNATLMDLNRDNEGRYYYATSLGLYIQSGNRLYRFDRNQGLPETSVRRVMVLDNGKLLAQQQNGIYLLDPAFFDSIQFEPVKPMLTDLHTNKTSLVFQDRVVLPLGERSLNASLALPEFFNESLHQFSWRLWPLEKEWQPWSSRNELIYTHLRPGEYRLEYRARNGIDPDVRAETPIEIVVPPKLHETGLSMAALIMAAGLVLMLIVLQVIRRVQVKQRRELELEMEKLRVATQLASTVAHEFNNPLQVLQGAYYMLQREDLSPEERKRYLDLIPQYTSRMNELIQRLLGLNQLKEMDYAAGMKILALEDDASNGDTGTDADSPTWDPISTGGMPPTSEDEE